jgi:hypothetical protein
MARGIFVSSNKTKKTGIAPESEGGRIGRSPVWALQPLLTLILLAGGWALLAFIDYRFSAQRKADASGDRN